MRPQPTERHLGAFLSASEYLLASGIDLVICDLDYVKVNPGKVGCLFGLH